jgi:hypothetical protein
LVSKFVDKPVLYAFILKYFNKNHTALNGYDVENYKSDFELSSKDLEDLREHLNFYGSEIPKKDFEKLKTKFSLYVKAGLAKCLWQYDGFYKVINQKDVEIRKAIEFAPKSKKTLDQMVASKNKIKSNYD